MRRLACLLTNLVASVSCGAPPIDRAPARAAAPHAATIILAPHGKPAARYELSAIARPPPGAWIDALMAAVDEASRRSGVSTPRWDNRLHAVANDVASMAPDNEALPYRAVEFALHYHGIVEPTPHLVVLWSERDDPEAVVSQLSAQVASLMKGESYARVGVAAASRRGKVAVVVVLQASFVELQPIARTARPGEVVRLRGRVLEPYGRPEVLVTRANGGVTPVSVRTGEHGTFLAEPHCNDQPGVMRLEVSGVSSTGASVLANFPIWCGVEPPTALDVAVGGGPGAHSAAAAEAQLIELVNGERRRAGLPVLKVADDVAAVARAYSEEMARTNLVAHVSPQSGTADDRLRHAGIRRGLVEENLARAAGPEEAHDGLMNSPGHRANILSPQATHLGIGVAFDGSGRELFLTELFTRIPPPVDRDATRRQIADAIRGARAMRVDEALARLAQREADKLASGASRDDVSAHIDEALQSMASKYRRMRTFIVALSDTSQFALNALPVDGATHFGVGVAQGDQVDIGAGAIFVVVLMAQGA